LLLDTHVVLWSLADDPRLGDVARQLVSDESGVRFVSSATIWEIEVKVALGKIRVDGEIRAVLAGAGVEPLDIGWFHAETAARLPPHHRDPFDRMLIAQARCEGLTLLTSDDLIRQYDVALIDATK
jgi:PIN domain nuclease of toxin-antitoxin system